DLVRAGVLPPLEVGLNVLLARRFEGHQWLYTKSFDARALAAGERASLVFGGIDTLADVFLNGEKIGESANMLVERRFDVTGRIRPGANVVQVLIRSVFYETQRMDVGQRTYHMQTADNVPFRKAAHMGGWDIFPRLYASGLWRGVSLEIAPPLRLDRVAWQTFGYGAKGERHWCRVRVNFRVEGPIGPFTDGSRVRFSVSRRGREAGRHECALHSVHNSQEFGVGEIELWWPKGSGAQPLYDAVVEVVSPAGEVLARDERRIGFRTVELVRDDVYGPERPGQFLFKVNGEPIYVRGSNWVPVDALHGRDAERIVPTLELFDALNCNMVRVWGGGVYEPQAFYDYCDGHGLMVWQDFMTGCAQFPQDDAYAQATADEVKAVVVALRNHPSIVLWSGNNENDSSVRWSAAKEFADFDPNLDRLSRETIPRVLREFDVTRPYLPSSPYVSPDVHAGKARSAEMHLWGARAYYKTDFYTNSPCWFASEMGYHGAPNRASLERMMTRPCVYPWTNPGTNDCRALAWNDEWQLKASNPFLDRTSWLWRRNDLMTNQARLMFGDVERDLDEFIAESQTIQAEAMKTFCELFRSRKFTRFNGLVWWNVRDGWPQISDAVVDYYGGKKLAYYALAAAQRDVLALLLDDHSAWVVNDLRRPVGGTALYRDKASGKVLLSCGYSVAANAKTRLGDVPFAGQGLVEIEYTVDGGGVRRNHFLYGEPPFRWADVRAWTDGATIWRQER
ncbi:MAG: glycoside hydrolase family 2, partial [Kiritimatiellae bacterium]|nr:glycoside hydrolase family 2 [Kiritimatiellia bacterium]